MFIVSCIHKCVETIVVSAYWDASVVGGGTFRVGLAMYGW